INSLEKVIEEKTLNQGKLISESDEVKQIFKYADEKTRELRELRGLILVRDSSIKILQKYKNIAITDEVELYGDTIPFSHARLLGIQAFLSCSWSVYDIITNYGRQLISGKPISERDSYKSFRHLFINTRREKEGDDNPIKYSPSLLINSLTNKYALEVEYFYAIRNIFLHESTIETVDCFVDNKTGADCYKLTEPARNKLKSKIADITLSRNELNALLRKTDLLEIFEDCMKKVDEAHISLLHSATTFYTSLIHSIILSIGPE
ncbi:MAG: hypothetical protein WBW71_12635, partial [Bacteroidota bacterium]